MESFLPDTIKAILGAGIVVAFAMNRLSYAFPHTDWLQYFRLPVPDVSEEERERRRRSGNRYAALEMAGLGLLLPLIYVGSSIMFFSDPDPIVLALVCLASVALIGLSVWVFVKTF